MKQDLFKFYRGPDEEDYNDDDFEDDYQLYCREKYPYYWNEEEVIP